MPVLTLPWYPPAPAAGPASLLQLPPDTWALEPKIDGIRVIWLNGRPYTRHGGLLTSGKGSNRLTQFLAEIPHTVDGEWVPAWDTFFAFDLPDCPLDYDGRRATMAHVLGVTEATDCVSSLANDSALALATTFSHVRLVASYTAEHFSQVYVGLKSHSAEGVVFKRRRALYAKQLRPGVECRDWLKRRFRWD